MTQKSARLDLYNRLDEVLGPGNADTLMERLPMETYGALATKADLEVVRDALRADIDILRGEIRELAAGQRDYQKTLLVTVIGAMTALTTIFIITALVL